VIAAVAEYETDAPGTCWECGGPCLTHKGTVHGWRCSACLNRYLDEGASKGAERDRRERDRLDRKQIRHDNTTSTVTAEETASRRWA
jgi:hypothetical protein